RLDDRARLAVGIQLRYFIGPEPAIGAECEEIRGGYAGTAQARLAAHDPGRYGRLSSGSHKGRAPHVSAPQLVYSDRGEQVELRNVFGHLFEGYLPAEYVLVEMAQRHPDSVGQHLGRRLAVRLEEFAPGVHQTGYVFECEAVNAKPDREPQIHEVAV